MKLQPTFIETKEISYIFYFNKKKNQQKKNLQTLTLISANITFSLGFCFSLAYNK